MDGTLQLLGHIMQLIFTRWKVGKKELRGRFPERGHIVDIREVTQSKKDTK